ncbi:MAG: hypothetical protein M3P29_01220 [Acidobacteriota bacterium]|nr:hypothetical protein [Acidobacteriota bacterium]
MPSCSFASATLGQQPSSPPPVAKRLAAANPRAKLLLLEGMNHVLKSVPPDKEKQMASYGDPTLQLAPDLLVNVVDFERKAGK